MAFAETLVGKLEKQRDLTDEELVALIDDARYEDALFRAADGVRRQHYGTDVYVRGLIELSNYCKNDCYYCGIRRGNEKLQRYRLSKEEILECCQNGYLLGFRTFVLQGGEDPFFTDDKVCDIVSAIMATHPDCAVTLSLGEKSRESYQRFFDAGAARYLLRHETADEEHYRKLHPDSMNLTTRKACLWALKDIGFQVGSGFMVGSPYQSTEMLVADLRFLQELQPDMIGIGPYLSHQDTPFAHFADGDLRMCLRLVAILRLLFPKVLLPATTALGTIDPMGRELGLSAGANVVMPNLSPVAFRKLYELYDNKICTGEEAAECKMCLTGRVASVGYEIVTDIGHAKTRQARPGCGFER